MNTLTTPQLPDVIGILWDEAVEFFESEGEPETIEDYAIDDHTREAMQYWLDHWLANEINRGGYTLESKTQLQIMNDVIRPILEEHDAMNFIELYFRLQRVDKLFDELAQLGVYPTLD
jgi:hypothetical protein